MNELEGVSIHPDDFTSEPEVEPAPKQDTQTAPPKVREFPLILSQSAPLDSAYRFINDCYKKKGKRTLHFYQGEFFRYEGTHYRPVDIQGIKTELYDFLRGAKVIDTKGGYLPFDPNRKKVGDVLDALKAASSIASEAHLPIWLNTSRIPPGEILVFKNGLLHLPTRRLIPHTPAFFAIGSLPYSYNPEAGPPVQWLKFLKQLWPRDPFSISTLQEWFGYCLSPDTSQQKIFTLIGPKRSGKGTIVQVLTKLLGVGAVCGLSLKDFSQPFGLQPLIGKRLAVVSDARLGKADQSTMIERLLSISGEDLLTIHRKRMTAWIGKLPTKIMILSNELPALQDQSSAAPSRLLVLKLIRSFLGKEDTTLGACLAKEVSQILSWALDGLDRLHTRGHFHQPKSAKKAIEQLEELGSPVGEFIRDKCTLGPEFSIATEKLFKEWRKWCSSQGIAPGPQSHFGRNLRAVDPSVEKTRPRQGSSRIQTYTGIKLNVR